MAILNKIVVQNYRNITLAELEFSPKVNCISGDNGEGKTNLMDAIYYLSMTKSAFSTSEKFNFRFGTDNFSLSGDYTMSDGLRSLFSVQVSSSLEKKLKKDSKPVKRMSEHIGELPIVMVSPSDTSLVSDSGEERRKFLNNVLSQMDRSFLYNIQQYNRLLVGRNKLLKLPQPDMDLIASYDARMSSFATAVHEARASFVKNLSPIVADYYAMLSGGKEQVSIQYVSDLDKGDLESILASSRERDMALRYTSAGVQRDELVFLMNGNPIRKCGSQGQQKSFLVSLKFAQYELMKRNYGFPPILLLDDVFDKLDMNRISNLLSMVAGNEFGQIFITDSNKVRLEGILNGITEDKAFFETTAGDFRRTDI